MLENGRSNNEKSNSKKKYIGIVGALAAVLILAGLLIYFVRKPDKMKYSFDKIEEQYFYNFNVAFPNADNYSFESVDAYCIEDEEQKNVIHYYIHAKYKAYIDILEKWDNIDEVSYGTNEKLENSYSLSWDSIKGFEDVNENFKKAVKEGVHKSYTAKEIETLINQNKPK